MRFTRANAARRLIPLFVATPELERGAYVGDAAVWKDRSARYYIGGSNAPLAAVARVETIRTVGELVALGLDTGATYLTPAAEWLLAKAELAYRSR